MVVKYRVISYNLLKLLNIFQQVIPIFCCKKGVCNMRKIPTLEEQENALSERLIAIRNQIRELEYAAEVIVSQIDAVRKSNADLRDVKRISSVNRAIAEKVIIEVLGSSNKPVRTSDLIRMIDDRVKGINSSTVRSYIFRMEKKGTIKCHARGYWVLPRLGR